MLTEKYEEIRPWRDAEVPDVIDRLLKDPDFSSMLEHVYNKEPIDSVRAAFKAVRSIEEFQRTIIYPIVRKVANLTCDSLDLSGYKYLDKTQAYTFVSNHRDIVLDSAFLDILLLEKELDTFEIAIGDNLLIQPWINDLVRLNKSFLVKRNLPVRQQLASSFELSSYMHETLKEGGNSIWIAQREGRAKDSDDRTQESVLKMLNLGGTGSVLENLASLKIVPVSISYEYDPCDYLKAMEMQLKRDQPDYRKTQADDYLNMRTGIMGYKGRVFYKINPCISDEILRIEERMHKNELFNRVASLMDDRIHRGYHLYPGNYVAADLLDGLDAFSSNYSIKEKERFIQYLENQLKKIEIPDKDEAFLRKRMLEMYANPLKNKRKAETGL